MKKILSRNILIANWDSLSYAHKPITPFGYGVRPHAYKPNPTRISTQDHSPINPFQNALFGNGANKNCHGRFFVIAISHRLVL